MFIYFYGKSISISDGVRKSGFVWNPRKVKKTSEMSKTIVAIKSYIDSLYILGDICSSARSRHVKTKLSLKKKKKKKKKKNVNNCYLGMFLG